MNVIKEKRNLIAIEKGTINRNRKTNKKMRNIKEHLTHLVIKILLNYRNGIC